jgi:hypothetical protein
MPEAEVGRIEVPGQPRQKSLPSQQKKTEHDMCTSVILVIEGSIKIAKSKTLCPK